MNVQDQHTDVIPHKRVLNLMVDYKENGIQAQTMVDTPAGTMRLLAFDHGTRLKEHTAPNDVYIFILEGEANVTIEGQPFQLHAGDTITLPATRPHAVEAKTPFKMLLTMFRA